MSMRRVLRRVTRPREAALQQRVARRCSHQTLGMCTTTSSQPAQQQTDETQRTAHSLRDVARGHVVHSLLLPSSQDLVCKNMMCEHVGSSCACKLSLVLERLPQLQEMDLSNNQLRFLPESTFQLAQLARLDLSRNQLTELSASVTQLQQLQVLDLSHNRIKKLPEDALLALPMLREVRVDGNPLEIESVASDELRAKIVTDA
ncbi:Toll/interleukin receptor [Globisporangium polare]